MTPRGHGIASLREYYRKRNFTRTAEPRGKLRAQDRHICSSSRSTPRGGCTTTFASSSTAC